VPCFHARTGGAHGVANGAAEIGQLARAEDEQNDDQNDDEMHWLQSAHDVFPLLV